MSNLKAVFICSFILLSGCGVQASEEITSEKAEKIALSQAKEDMMEYSVENAQKDKMQVSKVENNAASDGWEVYISLDGAKEASWLAMYHVGPDGEIFGEAWHAKPKKRD
ncbi:hypothetical protein [Bacillus marinisedimentorum]|uniref:hypothetical protein n=1 Tax=Bacillus marinisedimentorum TaxID=1821260 RepID=UPI0007E2020E|nr:hypothetical protein [Bacillus marinisedimentorum]